VGDVVPSHECVSKDPVISVATLSDAQLTLGFSFVISQDVVFLVNLEPVAAVEEPDCRELGTIRARNGLFALSYDVFLERDAGIVLELSYQPRMVLRIDDQTTGARVGEGRCFCDGVGVFDVVSKTDALHIRGPPVVSGQAVEEQEIGRVTHLCVVKETQI